METIYEREATLEDILSQIDNIKKVNKISVPQQVEEIVLTSLYNGFWDEELKDKVLEGCRDEDEPERLDKAKEVIDKWENSIVEFQNESYEKHKTAVGFGFIVILIIGILFVVYSS